MPDRYDVIVVGLGAMGSAAAAHLARAGYEVLGLDRHEPPHPYGSSHGRTRVIRTAYFEDPSYVPWVQRSWELWRELEAATGREIVERTGGLHLGTPEGTQVPGARRALDEHGLAREDLTTDEVRERFPAFDPAPGHEAVAEEDAGFVQVHPAIEAHLEVAREHGADLAFGRQAWGWAEKRDHVRVSTHEGPAYRADDVVAAMGPWLPRNVEDLDVGFEVERQVQFVLDPPGPLTAEGGRLPVFTYEPEPGTVFYGIHRPDGLAKVAIHHGGRAVDPDEVQRIVTDTDEEPVRRLLSSHAPRLDGPVEETMVCLYTNTPDRHFLLDRHPKGRRVVLVSPCSGHGFKVAPAVGEAVEQLVTGRDTELDRSLFRADRFEA
jgi:sarcosine oxidase